ncbi:MAG: J domain-containing protein [Thermomicrobiales bacterium]
MASSGGYRSQSQGGQGSRGGGTRSRPGSVAAVDPDADTLYQLLNVPFTATKADITKAYRESMRRVHPDRVPENRRAAAENLSKDLNAAYAILSDPAKRRAYDQTIRQQEIQDQIMKRYVPGFSGPAAGTDPFGQGLKRDITASERRDRQRSERSAFVTILSAFLVVTLGVIGLLILFSLASWGLSRIF